MLKGKRESRLKEKGINGVKRNIYLRKETHNWYDPPPFPSLPGSYNYQGQSLDSIKDQALADAQKLAKSGFDGFLMQNANDRPASLEVCLEKVAYMSVIGAAIRQIYPQIPLGIGVTCWVRICGKVKK